MPEPCNEINAIVTYLVYLAKQTFGGFGLKQFYNQMPAALAVAHTCHFFWLGTPPFNQRLEPLEFLSLYRLILPV